MKWDEPVKGGVGPMKFGAAEAGGFCHPEGSDDSEGKMT